jgi:cyanophycin synthetase
MLREQNVTFETIISSNKKIYLSKVSNYHNGASIDNIPLVNVHPENIEMFKKVNQVLDVKLSGIDFITTNISVPYYLEGVIIEVNERPDLQIHYDITDNKKDFIKKYVDKIFKENISYEYI